jgi:hypothetical protein
VIREPEEVMEIEENNGVGNKQQNQEKPNQNYQLEDEEEEPEDEDRDPNRVEYACGIFLPSTFLIIGSQCCDVG